MLIYWIFCHLSERILIFGHRYTLLDITDLHPFSICVSKVSLTDFFIIGKIIFFDFCILFFVEFDVDIESSKIKLQMQECTLSTHTMKSNAGCCEWKTFKYLESLEVSNFILMQNFIYFVWQNWILKKCINCTFCWQNSLFKIFALQFVYKNSIQSIKTQKSIYIQFFN